MRKRRPHAPLICPNEQKLQGGLMIPFRYGTIVSDTFFCGRKELIRQITELIESSQNIVLHGERRMGKSSLVYEIVRRHKKFQLINIDFMEVKGIDDACRRIVKSVVSMKFKKGFFDRIVENLASLRPTIGVDPATGMPSLSLDSRFRIEIDSLNNIFSLIAEANRVQPVVIFFDEFQDTMKMNNSREFLAVLRSKIQYLSDVSFVFAGSARSRMDEIFSDPESPFFKSSMPISVGKIEQGEFRHFIIDRLKMGKREVRPDILDNIFSITDSVSGDIQQFCEAIWCVTEENTIIGEREIEKALKLIFSHEKNTYQNVLNNITEFQFRVAKAVANFGGNEPFSNAFFEKTGFTNASSVRAALAKLVKSNVLFILNHEYRFVNPFFKMWLLHEFV
jgi:hypothetical protein